MISDLIISLDSSTSASKAIIWDLQGNIVAKGCSNLNIIQEQPDWYEQSAEAWWNTACMAFQQAANQIDPRRLAAVCIAHQRETFVMVSEDGHPLRPGILWMDERARHLMSGLKSLLDADHFHQVTGKPLSGNLTVGKIAWLRTYEPELFDSAYMFLDVHAYLVRQLTGLFRTGFGCVDPMGLFDMRHNNWSDEILAGLGTDVTHFPTVLPTGSLLGTVTKEAAKASHLPEGLPVITGIGDGQAACLGANISHQGECYISLGTSVVSGTISESYVTNRAFRTMYAGIPNTYILETALLGGAYTLQWFLNNFSPSDNRKNDESLSPEKLMEDAARLVPAGSEGLLLVPYWNSVMNPYWDEAARGIIVGWTGTHRKQHVYRSILEGIAFEQRLHTTGVEKVLKMDISRYVVVGGGAQSDLWCQIIADVTGKRVYRTHYHEATALGAAVLGASAVGLYPNASDAANAMVNIDPNFFKPVAERQIFYDRLYNEVYINLFPALQIYIDHLTDIISTSVNEKMSQN
jgi:sugar (pentulose or hexulose) kinase